MTDKEARKEAGRIARHIADGLIESIVDPWAPRSDAARLLAGHLYKAAYWLTRE